MVNIREVQNEELNAKVEEHKILGGALRISVYEIKENYLGDLPNEYDAHLVTARQTLEKQNYEWNLHWNKVASKNQTNSFPFAKTNYDILDKSGQRIELEQFLGPHFDLEKHKPIIKGQLGNETISHYFYYDEEEILKNKVDLNEIVKQYEVLYPNNLGWFIHALLEPPFNMKLERNVKRRGDYVIEFLDFFFSDINKLIIYGWSTDCSVIFKDGKEWWGSHFWTVYNPAKQWYIGIIASQTD